MERNSDYLRLARGGESQRIKTVDSYIMKIMLQDAFHYKTDLKFEEEDYIFIL